MLYHYSSPGRFTNVSNQNLSHITVPQFSHLQNVCARKTSLSHLWLLTQTLGVRVPNRWQVFRSAGDDVNEWINEVSGGCDWSVIWPSGADLEAARLQKPFTTEDTVIHMLSAPEMVDKEPGGNVLPTESIMLCRSIYCAGESIIAPILKLFPLL